MDIKNRRITSVDPINNKQDKSEYRPKYTENIDGNKSFELNSFVRSYHTKSLYYIEDSGKLIHLTGTGDFPPLETINDLNVTNANFIVYNRGIELLESELKSIQNHLQQLQKFILNMRK
jgi:hypothetical protein